MDSTAAVAPLVRIHERGNNSGRPDVEGQAEHPISRVARLDVDQVLPHHRGRDGSHALLEHGRQRAQQAGTVRDLQPLDEDRLFQPLEMAAGILQHGLLQREEELAYVGLEQNEPPDAHGRGLRRVHQAWDVALGVLGHDGLTRQTPPLVEFVGQVTVVSQRSLGVS